MIFDQRTYICKVGMVQAQLAIYQKYGMAAQYRHLGEPVLFATTEVGDISTYVHIWAYKDLADRAARRKAMIADPEWQAYMKASLELGALITQQNSILVATPFSKQGQS